MIYHFNYRTPYGFVGGNNENKDEMAGEYECHVPEFSWTKYSFKKGTGLLQLG